METPSHGRLSKLKGAVQDIAAMHELPSTAQTRSPSYRLAFDDKDFLLNEDLRGMRLQLELQKTEMIMQEHNVVSTIAVFGSARIFPDKPTSQGGFCKDFSDNNCLQYLLYYQKACDFSFLVTTDNNKREDGEFVICTGGGPGIMEAANKGAAKANGRSIGLNVILKNIQIPNQYITPELCFNFHYFSTRKMHFLMRAKAVVIFPGGYGTLDELFETLTLIQTGRMAPVPILLFGTEYWEKIINFDMLVTEGMISLEDMDLFRYVDIVEEGWECIKSYYSL